MMDTPSCGCTGVPNLSIETTEVLANVFELPWDTPLEDWDSEWLTDLPRGISRHVVRFARSASDGHAYALKEIGAPKSRQEYEMLHALERAGVPAVEPAGIVTGRQTPDCSPLADIVITRFLRYSLPYRTLFGPTQSFATVRRLIDALSVLLARLHLAGFFWGDVSLSNVLFRRDAGEFAAYLVDAETVEHFDHLTDSRREYELDMARTNIIGELMDLQAGGVLPEHYEPIAIGDMLIDCYRALWKELTGETAFAPDERWKVNERVERLNQLGFEIGEMSMRREAGGPRLVIRPKVVEAGHFSRAIERLTGMRTEENQARHLLNDIDQYRAISAPDMPLEAAATSWMREIFEPTVALVPQKYRDGMGAPQLYVSILEHRWYMSEKAGCDVTQAVAAKAFVTEVLETIPQGPALDPFGIQHQVTF